ncbi:hypothetical protein GCM10010994_36320 [Chelatococcus reniformis]|uniref:Uncharacterized protein n=1 Tax=Chelatococcus reniformis TaxID=1494448 RepID=A0A916UIR2_9HYPH|nr:hypothetical protein GCM10010994_36320 [Chelatococcus reniformis]
MDEDPGGSCSEATRALGHTQLRGQLTTNGMRVERCEHASAGKARNARPGIGRKHCGSRLAAAVSQRRPDRPVPAA